MNKHIRISFLALLVLTSIARPATANDDPHEGVSSGGGGDAKTEGRIYEVRADFLNWINLGGAKALTLPKDMGYEDYVHGNQAKNLLGMANLLEPGAVVVTAITTAQEDPTKEELSLLIDGQPKTCRGFISKIDLKPHILCNVERFWMMNEDEQYRQIHHEYAGLGRLEKNVGAASDYFISDQIAANLETVEVRRLVVKPKPVPIETDETRNCPGNEYKYFFDTLEELHDRGLAVTKLFACFKAKVATLSRKTAIAYIRRMDSYGDDDSTLDVATQMLDLYLQEVLVHYPEDRCLNELVSFGRPFTWNASYLIAERLGACIKDADEIRTLPVDAFIHRIQHYLELKIATDDIQEYLTEPWVQEYVSRHACSLTEGEFEGIRDLSGELKEFDDAYTKQIVIEGCEKTRGQKKK